MFKTILTIVAVIFLIAYFNDPKSVQPWLNSADHAGVIVTHAVQNAGEAVEKSARDQAHKDSVIDKTTDKIHDVVTGK